MQKIVVVVNYNTTELTNACCKSVFKYNPDVKLIVFDNSDKTPFVTDDKRIIVIDNTKGQVIDFEQWLKKFPNKTHTINDYGTAKHCKTIDILCNVIYPGYVHLDSDVICKRSLSDLFDENYAQIGSSFTNSRRGIRLNSIPRIHPCMMWVNTKMLKQNNIKYFDAFRIQGLGNKTEGSYDTGSSVLEDINKKGLPVKYIKHTDYVNHLGGASYMNRDIKTFLKDNEKHWK